ncbi:MAG: class I adenylate-forming enzyme family protein [Janthinobacterium lividum]
MGTESPWRTRLYRRLRGQSLPLLVSEDTITPAGSLWAGMRLWTAAFREAGLRPGDRVVLALPPSSGFVCALLAGLWEGLTLALMDPTGNVQSASEILDAAAAIGAGQATAGVTWQADVCGLPVQTGLALRRSQLPPSPEVRFLLATSGTTHRPRWIALSDRNVLSVLDSHSPHLDLEGARLLSALPWHHVFGLVIDLLPALLAGAEIIRDSRGGRDPAALIQLMQAHGITHFNAVPLTVERLLQTPGGEVLAAGLHGVIGGAPVSAPLAALLSRTHLRVGYGQTEASPGISLGAPGRWEKCYLGQPVGCTVRVTPEGRLHFRGPNACLGTWEVSGLKRLAPDRWIDTGDLVRAAGSDLYFTARADDGFKLSNGHFVQAGFWESHLKTQVPGLQEALLYSPDGEKLELLVAGSAIFSSAISLQRACELLGPLGRRLSAVRHLPHEQWAKTRKGELDRYATICAFEAMRQL